ncbi:MAG: preprotein translocase subunit YajC [Planctomycetes bacterium]|nr:preprotein translocase subunit YajC [Planctomycetota bacterium]
MLTHIANNLMLAQEGPPAPSDSAITQSTGGNGPPGVNQAAQSSAPNNSFLLLLFVVFLVFIVFSMMGQRRDKKKRVSMLNAIKKHDKVQTIGGVLGAVVEIKPDTVVLKVDESSNTRITFARSSIQQVLTSDRDSAIEPHIDQAGS